MQRIVVLGNAGSGKSTLSRRLGDLLNLPVVHLDRLFWEPGWTRPNDGVFRDRVGHAVAGDSWICEGNYARHTFDLRLPRADRVIWLDTPRATCVSRVMLRSTLGGARPDLPAGCVEQLNAEFLSFLRYVWAFDRESRPPIEAERLTWGPCVPVTCLKSKRQISAFLSAVA